MNLLETRSAILGTKEEITDKSDAQVVEHNWSRRVGLNHRPADYESAALPLSYAGLRGYEKRNLGSKNSVSLVKTPN